LLIDFSSFSFDVGAFLFYQGAGGNRPILTTSVKVSWNFRSETWIALKLLLAAVAMAKELYFI
jgi:hypothetical protein